MSLPSVIRSSARRTICSVCVASSSRHTLASPPIRRSFRTTYRSLANAVASTLDADEELRSSSNLDHTPSDLPARKTSRSVAGQKAKGKTFQAPKSRKFTASAFLPPAPPTPLEVARRILARLPEFSKSKRLSSQVHDYGLTSEEERASIDNWAWTLDDLLNSCSNDDAEAKAAFQRSGFQLDRLIQSIASAEEQGLAGSSQQAIEHALTRNYVQAASRDEAVKTSTRDHLRTILSLTDLTNIAFSTAFLPARSMRRHFHLHLGPTNSGKTYNALKALAQAKSGAYAGPLRLLAHEVWERLNQGTVGGLDGQGKACNLLTGEDHRVVDPTSQLLSCTVEMLPLSRADPYEVVVIDEIQMLKDVARGGAWSKALIGVKAKEIHLCGDETMLDMLSGLIPSLGDTMEVHRYDRLTPLKVADKSLGGDFGKFEKGDCAVTFSRNNIFAVKKQIEQVVSRKCAVVYGALPPETRAEQARNFNDPNTHEEILVASDAVGMGLNLKIKRLVFINLTKWNGSAEVPLTLTQIKQIAGRAGRFGTRDNDSDKLRTASKSHEDKNDYIGLDDAPDEGGVVTTLHDSDLPLLRELLPIPLQSARQMVIDVPTEIIAQMATLLPPSTKFSSLLQHVSTLAVVPPNMTTGALDLSRGPSEVIDAFASHLSLHEMSVFNAAPVNLKDPVLKHILGTTIHLYTRTNEVKLKDVFRASELPKKLDVIEATLAILPPLPPVLGIGRLPLLPPIVISSIPSLETLHKGLVLYLWLSFRLPLAFPDREAAEQLKQRCEVVLEDCIERIPGVRQKKHLERTREGDRAVANWRATFVAPNGTKKFEGSDPKGVQWVEEAIAQRLKNKGAWNDRGSAPDPSKWLNEVDGRGQGQPPAPPRISAAFRNQNLKYRLGKSRHSPDFKAHSGWYPADPAAPKKTASHTHLLSEAPKSEKAGME
ncbi:P-loop containing nucleoside triphosphate hydrolase protein [Kockovaella imperatae]|uniref:RNA helicase n=1 Tax=Kockovaella imperatae TaxID=4999 RepID=A0A1Y1UQD1_9TREE|nr:P-loop containing nucleoside triphosphate hydrolase protein [Kockovaella imperatae]ORX40270.1 P-loop containing nucleoside triphosphate hydrolase protein [Kockovaella imperatae]